MRKPLGQRCKLQRRPKPNQVKSKPNYTMTNILKQNRIPMYATLAAVALTSTQLASGRKESPTPPANTSEKLEKAKPENVMFELLVGNKELDKSHAASFNDNFNKVAFASLQKLQKRFASTKTQKIETTKRIGDFSLSIISFNNKTDNAAHTTALFLVRQDAGWKYFHEDNFKKDNLADNPFNDKQMKDIKSLFQWGEENGL